MEGFVVDSADCMQILRIYIAIMGHTFYPLSSPLRKGGGIFIFYLIPLDSANLPYLLN